jgi:hypothetical protein
MTQIEKAFCFSREYHEGQLKKGTQIPYLYHPLAVASSVLKFGGTDAQVQAALLHDTIADGKVSRQEITDQFGEEVAELTFSFADPEIPGNSNPNWRELKAAYLEKLKKLKRDALFVIACEELHDGTELLFELRYRGVEVWKRYPVHGMEVFWYYRELLQIFLRQLNSEKDRSLVSEFGSFLKQMKDIVFEGARF